MYNILVVVADCAKARLYGLEKKGKPMVELADLVHTEARLRQHKIISDRPGRTFDSKGSGRHAKELSSPFKLQEATRFAQQICAYIDAERNKHKFSGIVLIAAPEFLGVLRKNLGKECTKLVTHEVDKDLVLKRESVIRKYLLP